MSEVVVSYTGVPWRIELDDGVVIRRYVEADIPHLVDVVNANLDHLRPWMPWAQEPATVEQQSEWFRETEKAWADGTGFVYGIYDDDGRLLGGTGYHVRNGPGGIEIGYWLAKDATGRGLMTRVTHALVDAARAVAGVRFVEIHCAEGNDRSAAVPRRLGFRMDRMHERAPAAPAENGREEIWLLEV
jgi:RimJ/RimL family protein N-acetyltransferase